MDFYNTLYWLFHDGRYTEWSSIYPPLNFLILKGLWLALHGASPSASVDPVLLRSSAPDVLSGFIGISLVFALLSFTMRLWSGYPWQLRTAAFIAFFCSGPALEGVERGNLLLLCPVLLAAALSYPRLVSVIFLPILINLKPYFAMLLGVFALRLRWREFMIGSGVALTIFMITGALVDQHFFLLFHNLTIFQQGEPKSYHVVANLSFPSSISAFAYALSSNDFLGLVHLQTDVPAVVMTRTVCSGVQDVVLLASCAVFIFKGRLASFEQMFVALTICMLNLGMSIGGYTLVFYAVLFPALMRMRQWKIYLGLLIGIFFPLDFIPVLRLDVGIKHVFLSGATLPISWVFSLGDLLHPILNLAMLAVITWELYGARESGSDATKLDSTSVI